MLIHTTRTCKQHSRENNTLTRARRSHVGRTFTHIILADRNKLFLSTLWPESNHVSPNPKFTYSYTGVTVKTLCVKLNASSPTQCPHTGVAILFNTAYDAREPC